MIWQHLLRSICWLWNRVLWLGRRLHALPRVGTSPDVAVTDGQDRDTAQRRQYIPRRWFVWRRVPRPFPWRKRFLPTLEWLEARLVPAVQFTLAGYQVKNTSAYAIISVAQDTPVDSTVTVDYQASAGSATPGVNFTATTGTLTFAPEQLSNYFEVPILDAGHHGSLTVNLALSNPTNTGLGAQASATLTILHDPTAGDKATSVSLTSSDENAEFTEPVIFTASVSPAPHGHEIPTGYVTFLDGSAVLGEGAIDSNGNATFTTMTLDGGSHSISAQYSGDNDYAGSTSSVLTEAVNPDPATTTTLSATSNPAAFGQSVTFVATVSVVPPGMGTPTGPVNFMDGSTTLGSVSLTGGQASLSTSALPVGTASITAVYPGYGSYSSSYSSLSETVNKASTTTTVSSSASPSFFGQSVIFTATVSINSPAPERLAAPYTLATQAPRWAVPR